MYQGLYLNSFGAWVEQPDAATALATTDYYFIYLD